jgi:hypothetical protein
VRYEYLSIRLEEETCRYLLFMVVILPTFGFTTGEAYFNFLFMPHNTTDDSTK